MNCNQANQWRFPFQDIGFHITGIMVSWCKNIQAISGVLFWVILKKHNPFFILTPNLVNVDTRNYEDFLQYLDFEAVTKEMADVFIERIDISKEKMIDIHWTFNKEAGNARVVWQ